MIKQSTRKIASLFVASDLAATAFALAAAYALRFRVEIVPVTKGVPEPSAYLRLLPMLFVVWPIVYSFYGLYQVRRDRSRVDEAVSVFVATGLATLLLSGLATFYRGFSYSRLVLVLFFACDVLFVFLGRLAIRASLENAWRRGVGVRTVLIVGAGRLGRAVIDKLAEHPETGLRAVALTDDDATKIGTEYRGVPVVAATSETGRLVAERHADTVFLALPLEAHRQMFEILKRVAREGVEVRVVPDLLQYITFRAGIEDLDGLPVIHLTEVPMSGWMSLAKRFMDVCLSLAGLTIFLLLLPFIALAVYLEDRGPVFYSQERMGLDGKPFRMWKLRSMTVGAEKKTGPVWAEPNDPRRTRVGAFLRRWSLDELPQLWNVLKGEMSLVGPRPERPEFVAEFKERFPQYMLRHRVRSGMTGWAQVHGWRGQTSLAKRIEYDLYYIENWSIALDIKILWLTLLYGIRHNAY